MAPCSTSDNYDGDGGENSDCGDDGGGGGGYERGGSTSDNK